MRPKPTVLALLLLAISSSTRTTVSAQKNTQASPRQPAQQASMFSLNGLSNPAEVAGSIFVDANPPSSTASVVYYLDDQQKETATVPPFWLGGMDGRQPRGFSVDALYPGTHRLRAVAVLSGGRTVESETITLNVLPSINQQFSPSLTPYVNQLGAQQKTLAEMLAATTTAGAILSPWEQGARASILRMYFNWGIDPSIDDRNDQSQVLLSLAPTGWASAPLPNPETPLSLLFSPDAPFYQPIPARWPRTFLPPGYFHDLQLNTTQEGDGIGIGESVAGPNDPMLMVSSQWYDQATTQKTFLFPISPAWSRSLPQQTAGDMHMVFVDPRTRTFVSTYKTQLDPSTGGPKALAASYPTPLNSLGDRGGTIAAGFAELPILLQPGESTDPNHPIHHALGGSVARTWAARVYPASAWDGDVKTSVNSCTHAGFTNTGLVPYGGVIQLDPALDLSRLHLTLPALRILQAIQTYGYYVMDFGCADIDIYTSVPEKEFDPYGGLWGYNRRGPGVQNEVRAVLLNNRLSVVVPLTKKQ